MSLLRPLLLDIVPTIQQTAALALGRLANFNDDLAEAVVKGDILPQLVYSLAEQNVKINTFYHLVAILCLNLFIVCFVAFLQESCSFRLASSGKAFSTARPVCGGLRST